MIAASTPTYDFPDQVDLVVADLLDDPASIAGKLAERSGRRVALVLPNDSDVFDTPIAMHLLARAAARERIALAIVSRRRAVHYWAHAEGLRTFGAARAVPRVVAPPGALPSGIVRLLGRALGQLVGGFLPWLGALLFVGIVTLLALLLVPHATVRVRPVTDRLQSTVQLRASTLATAPDPTQGIVPGRSVYLLVPASGSVPVESADHPLDGRAVGSVTFENRTSNAVIIPKGTVVSTLSGTPFQTTEEGKLDPRVGAMTTIRIKAEWVGTGSNVQRGEIIVVGGSLHWLVTLVNEDAIAGGGAPGTAIVTAWDDDRLINQVTSEAQKLGEQQLQAQLGPGEAAVPETLSVTPIAETFSHQVGDVGDTLSVQAQFRLSAMIVNPAQINQVARQLWQPKVRPDFLLVPASVEVGQPTVTNATATTVNYTVPVDATAYKSVNAERVADYVRFRTPAQAEADLANQFDLAAPATVTVAPNWIGRAYRVDVVIDPSAAPTVTQ
jgi:hypothetical protein